VFNEQTTGASDDIEKATNIARKMVTDYGMSTLGPISYDNGQGNFWLAKGMTEGNKNSEELTAKIDNEIKAIIMQSYQKAKQVLTEKRAHLDKIAELLLQKETIENEDFKNIISG